MTTKLFKDRLEELIERNGLTQRGLAEKAGVTEVTISRYINGTRDPRNQIVMKLAEIFDVSVDYLLGRTDDLNGTVKINTIAAHSDNNLTDEERQKVEDFARFLISQRQTK